MSAVAGGSGRNGRGRGDRALELELELREQSSSRHASDAALSGGPTPTLSPFSPALSASPSALWTGSPSPSSSPVSPGFASDYGDSPLASPTPSEASSVQEGDDEEVGLLRQRRTKSKHSAADQRHAPEQPWRRFTRFLPHFFLHPSSGALRPLPLFLALLVSFLLLVLCGYQLVYLFTGHVCSLDAVVYADRSADARFWRVGAVRQRDVRDIVLEGMRQVANLFDKNGIKDWWLDCGMLLAYYRDPAASWIVWDTDGDVGVAVSEFPKLLQLDRSVLDSENWMLRTQVDAYQVDGLWTHAESCFFMLIHRHTGFRIEVWVQAVLPLAQLLQPPDSEPCADEWSQSWKDAGRPADLLFPLETVSVRGVQLQLPRRDRLHDFLDFILPGAATNGPLPFRRWICLSPQGYNDRWFAQQLLPDAAYRAVWEWRTAEAQKWGEEARKRDQAWERTRGAGSDANTEASVSAASSVAASSLSALGFFPASCVGFHQFEAHSPAAARFAAQFLQHEPSSHERADWIRQLRLQRGIQSKA